VDRFSWEAAGLATGLLLAVLTALVWGRNQKDLRLAGPAPEVWAGLLFSNPSAKLWLFLTRSRYEWAQGPFFELIRQG